MFQNGRSITPISFATPCTDFFGILVIRALSFRLDVFLVARPPLPLIRCFSIQLLTRLFLPVFMDPFQLLGAVFCVILSPQALASTDMVTTLTRGGDTPHPPHIRYQISWRYCINTRDECAFVQKANDTNKINHASRRQTSPLGISRFARCSHFVMGYLTRRIESEFCEFCLFFFFQTLQSNTHTHNSSTTHRRVFSFIRRFTIVDLSVMSQAKQKHEKRMMSVFASLSILNSVFEENNTYNTWRHAVFYSKSGIMKPYLSKRILHIPRATKSQIVRIWKRRTLHGISNYRNRI